MSNNVNTNQNDDVYVYLDIKRKSRIKYMACCSICIDYTKYPIQFLGLISSSAILVVNSLSSIISNETITIVTVFFAAFSAFMHSIFIIFVQMEKIYLTEIHDSLNNKDFIPIAETNDTLQPPS